MQSITVVQSITVPLVLITTGTLFLIEYSGGPPFSTTWPVLLILWGASWALGQVVSR
jgi:hypothetical protein